MKAKNKIIINFLKNLNTFGFLEIEEDKILHLPTNHILQAYEQNFFGEINIKDDSNEEDIEESETLILKINDNSFNINYRKIIDFYIEEYARRDIIKNGGNFNSSFKHMREHLERKFINEGYESELDEIE